MPHRLWYVRVYFSIFPLHPDSRLVSSPVQVSGKANKVHRKLSDQIKARMRTKNEFQALPVAQQSGTALFKDIAK